MTPRFLDDICQFRGGISDKILLAKCNLWEPCWGFCRMQSYKNRSELIGIFRSCTLVESEEVCDSQRVINIICIKRGKLTRRLYGLGVEIIHHMESYVAKCSKERYFYCLNRSQSTIKSINNPSHPSAINSFVVGQTNGITQENNSTEAYQFEFNT